MNNIFYFVLSESDTSLAVGRPVYFNVSGELKYCTSTDTPAVGVIISISETDGSTVACVGIMKQVLKCRAKDDFTAAPGTEMKFSDLYGVTKGTNFDFLGYALSGKDSDGLVNVIAQFA